MYVDLQGGRRDKVAPVLASIIAPWTLRAELSGKREWPSCSPCRLDFHRGFWNRELCFVGELGSVTLMCDMYAVAMFRLFLMRDVFVWGIGMMVVAPKSLSCHGGPMGQVSWHLYYGC